MGICTEVMESCLSQVVDLIGEKGQKRKMETVKTPSKLRKLDKIITKLNSSRQGTDKLKPSANESRITSIKSSQSQILDAKCLKNDLDMTRKMINRER